jgi:hypothetical protein
VVDAHLGVYSLLRDPQEILPTLGNIRVIKRNFRKDDPAPTEV